MKKLLIAMLITCSLAVAGCGRNNVENPSSNNNAGNEMTDGNNATDGNNTTDGTNSNTNGTNNQGSSVDETKTSLNNLYTEFKGKVQGGIENINADDWNEYSSEFKGKLTNLRNTVKDASITSTLDDMDNLFNEYDTAIRNKTDLAKDKIQEMQKRIEDALK